MTFHSTLSTPPSLHNGFTWYQFVFYCSLNCFWEWLVYFKPWKWMIILEGMQPTSGSGVFYRKKQNLASPHAMNFDLFKITSATGSIWNGHVAFGECLQHFRTILLPNFSSLYQWIWIVHYKLLLASPLGSFRLLPSGDFSEVLQHNKTISKPIQSTSATYLYSWSCLMFDCCSSINQNIISWCYKTILSGWKALCTKTHY